MKFLKKKKTPGPREGGVPRKIQEKGEGTTSGETGRPGGSYSPLVVVQCTTHLFSENQKRKEKII
jgi:hypothetical protein